MGPNSEMNISYSFHSSDEVPALEVAIFNMGGTLRTKVLPSELRHCSGYDSMIGFPAFAQSSKLSTIGERTGAGICRSAHATTDNTPRIQSSLAVLSDFIKRVYQENSHSGKLRQKNN